MPASRAAAKAAGICKKYTLCLLETLFSRRGPSWSCMRPAPQPGLLLQRWPGVLFIGECSSGLGNEWDLQDSRTYLPLAMQIEISPSPSASVQGVKNSRRGDYENGAGDNEMQARYILSARTWLKSHGTECWCRNASTSLRGDFEIREVPAAITVMTGSGLDRSCVESSCYGIRLEGGCDATRLKRHLCTYLSA